jgi:hypothetical protein
MISRLTLLLKGKVILAIVGTVLVAGGGTTIAVAATGAKVSIPLVSQATSSMHQSTSTSSTAIASSGQDSSHHDGQQAEGTVRNINSSHSSFTLTPVNGADVTVVVNTQTEFEGGLSDFTALKVGLQVEVTGTRQTDGSLLATKVEGQNESANNNQNNNQDENELSGSVMTIDATDSSFVLKLSDSTIKTIEVSPSTEFDGDGNFQSFSDLKVGQSVEVEGNLQSNGTIAATKVHREDSGSSSDDSGGSNGGDHGNGSGSGDGGGASGGNGSSTPGPSGTSDH